MRSLFLIICCLATANVVAEVDYDEVLSIREKLYDYYDKGIALHNSYNFNDLNQLKACVSKNGYLRDEVKQLQARVKDLDIFSFRVDLTLAADAAFRCVYCGGKKESCENIKNELVRMEGKLSDAGKLP